MNKLLFACEQLNLNPQVFLTKSKSFRKTPTEVNKRWIVFLFLRKCGIAPTIIARLTHFDRASIYNCFYNATAKQKQAADVLYSIYCGDTPDPQPQIRLRYIPDYLHSRVYTVSETVY